MQLRNYLQAVGIPGLISSISLLCAWLAISLLLSDQLKLSVVAAVAAFFFDSLDGYVARKLDKTSELGRQLDSMVDLVGYSLYSALLVSQVLLPNWQGFIVGFTIVLFGVLRLIRFNITGYTDTDSARYYSGIVTCHLSLAAISLLLITTHIAIPKLILATLLFVLAILQLSTIKTRKTGMLPFWYGVSILLSIGAIAWLS